MPKSDDSHLKQYLSRQYQNFNKKLPADQINATFGKNTIPYQIATDNHVVNSHDSKGNSRLDYIMSAHLVD